jgi:hypothetical protein
MTNIFIIDFRVLYYHDMRVLFSGPNWSFGGPEQMGNARSKTFQPHTHTVATMCKKEKEKKVSTLLASHRPEFVRCHLCCNKLFRPSLGCALVLVTHTV